MLNLEINRCTQLPETCPVVQHIFETDSFYAAVEGIDPTAEATRNMLGNFVTACAKGTCPGQNLEQTMEVLRKIRSLGEH